MSNFVKSEVGEQTPVYCVVIQDARMLASEIALVTGVRHQSPQALLIRNKKCVWNISHGGVNDFQLQEAVKQK